MAKAGDAYQAKRRALEELKIKQAQLLSQKGFFSIGKKEPIKESCALKAVP